MDSQGKEAVSEDRGGFRFRGGHLALDLCATLAGRLKEEPRELLETPADLDRWLVSSGLAGSTNRTTQDDVEMARKLREAIYALATGRPSSAARDTLNAVAALPDARPRLSMSGQLVMEGNAREYLATIAGLGVELLGTAERNASGGATDRAARYCSSTFHAQARGGGARCKAAATAPRRGNFEGGGEGVRGRGPAKACGDESGRWQRIGRNS